MESVIQVNDGSKFVKGQCIFCGLEATKVLGLVNIEDDRYNGHVLKGFHVCNKHVIAINRILDGTKDIEELVEHYENFKTGTGFNLRAEL